MKFSNYRCNNCNKVFEVCITKHLEDFPKNPLCIFCENNNTKRIYSNITFDVAEGKHGNAKTGYSTGICNHPSSIIGKQKGIKIKTIK